MSSQAFGDSFAVRPKAKSRVCSDFSANQRNAACYDILVNANLLRIVLLLAPM